ncbi:nucleoside/nucleotide kinase family protein [Cutibacterium sp. WCA-380-WT-3A]|uniref:Nucleoside/nucleotide kinase family protein n=1 Tax=Cutibacterium porci TaxID=2605781 RepID=A0A7K0J8X1_9ACTN|nr:nucleoside/nucleotide kinase family protein [Cutibacterium porci]MSS46390.1 nucleoside/nucleotide kinase family protein [Cutibacterium porci]
MTPDQAVERARALARSGRRRVLGLCGEPGAGKTTLSHLIDEQLGDKCAVVPMDGFHLAQGQIERLGRADRKGAPDTFDSWGFLSLVQRLAAAREPVIYAPMYQHGFGEPIAGAIPVPKNVPLVIVEGNYLLLDDEPWSLLAPLLAQAWYVNVAPQLRMKRLIRRHIDAGKSPDYATTWAHGPDERNAALI